MSLGERNNPTHIISYKYAKENKNIMKRMENVVNNYY